jgi:hypothetical protein
MRGRKREMTAKRMSIYWYSDRSSSLYWYSDGSLLSLLGG